MLLCHTVCVAALYSGAGLSGKVALVTGASRGIGRGVVEGLVEAGATVYFTARSISSSMSTEMCLGGSIEEVETFCKGLGTDGEAIGVQCDHSKDKEVTKVLDLIRKKENRLDILVNNAFAVPKRPDGVEDKDLLFRNFWEQPGWFYDSFMDVGLRSHYITSVEAAPLLMETAAREKEEKKNSGGPLIAHISSFGGVSYSFNVAYGAGKAAVDRLAKDMNIELEPRGVNCISVWPGVVRTERMMDMLDSGEWVKKTGLATPPSFIETPRLTGRVIARIYEDRERAMAKRRGKVAVVAEVARDLGIEDVDGVMKPSIR